MNSLRHTFSTSPPPPNPNTVGDPVTAVNESDAVMNSASMMKNAR